MKLKIIAHPNSKKPRIRKDLQKNLHVYVSEPPISGKANKAIIESLAKFLDISKSKVHILHGHNSKSKLVEIQP